MLKHIKSFLNVQFKIAEVEDDVYSESSSEEEEEEDKNDGSEESLSVAVAKDKVVKGSCGAKPEFPKSFIFSCIGIGLTNIARKTE
jgi:hypothetical protein